MMYSIVLMAALTTAPTTQSWHRGGCHGCQGCYGTRGYVAASCSCSCYCSGSYGCYGCYGSPWYGASYTSGSYGYGVGVVPVLQCHGCYGCYGGWSCYGYPTQQAHVEPAPPSTTPDKGPAPKPGKTFEEAPLPKEKKGNEEQARARVIVDLPADAKLYVDGQLMNAASARRIFQTPNLAPGQLYYYDLKAEVIRAGQTITSNQKVILRPGRAATVSFADLGQRRDATAQAGEQ
jgi:uncharacterized protein (TIGR03000 family)